MTHRKPEGTRPDARPDLHDVLAGLERLAALQGRLIEQLIRHQAGLNPGITNRRTI